MIDIIWTCGKCGSQLPTPLAAHECSSPLPSDEAGVVEITQADCDAAADLIDAYWHGANVGMRNVARSYRAGHRHGVFAHAFARHRIAALSPAPVDEEAVERLEGSGALEVRRTIVAAEQSALEAYLGDYVMSTEDENGCSGPDYEPNEWERSLIEDALQGYLVERDKAVREALAALPVDAK